MHVDEELFSEALGRPITAKSVKEREQRPSISLLWTRQRGPEPGYDVSDARRLLDMRVAHSPRFGGRHLKRGLADDDCLTDDYHASSGRGLARTRATDVASPFATATRGKRKRAKKKARQIDKKARATGPAASRERRTRSAEAQI
ncbi:hypothetical protein MRX96_041015 [Rhipicephalus microplus]